MRTIESLFNEFDYGLGEEKQAFVKNNWQTMPLLEVAKIAYNKQDIDERSEEYKQIKRFTIKLKREHVPLELSEEQRKTIRDMAPLNKPLDIARHVFQNSNLVPLSKEAKTVDKYIKVVLKLNEDEEKAAAQNYIPPRGLVTLIKKVNFAKPELDLRENNLSGFHRKSLEQLAFLLKGPRFISMMNQIQDQEEKNLFENNFIEGVYGKELNSEEINMYISLCSDYVTQKQIKSHLDMINAELKACFEDEDKTLRMTLSDAYGKKSEEYDKCLKRIKSMQESLSGSRSKRVEIQALSASSLINFVEAWKSEDERKRAIIIARATQSDVEKELTKIESMGEYVARIMGVSKEELIHG